MIADYHGLEFVADLPCNVINCDQYCELKKALIRVRKAIAKQIWEDGFEERGNLPSREYRYVGDNPNLLKGMMPAIVKKDLVD